MGKNWEDIKNDDFDAFGWNTTTVVYIAGAEITREKGCNGYTATNLGDTIALINGQRLFPSATPLTVAGDSISIIGNRGEIFKGRITLKFIAPVGVLPRVEIIQKFYTNYQ